MSETTPQRTTTDAGVPAPSDHHSLPATRTCSRR
jgi:hypothetical protein